MHPHGAFSFETPLLRLWLLLCYGCLLEYSLSLPVYPRRSKVQGRRTLGLVRPPTRSGRATSQITRVSIVIVVVVVMGYSFLFCAPQRDNSRSIPGYKSRKEVKVPTLLLLYGWNGWFLSGTSPNTPSRGKCGPTPVDNLQ